MHILYVHGGECQNLNAMLDGLERRGITVIVRGGKALYEKGWWSPSSYMGIQDAFHREFYLDNLANVASLDSAEPSCTEYKMHFI
jgi:hypothetical protein